jgi:hypothetical protein
VTASAAASPVSVTVGDPITVTVALDAPSHSTVTLTNPPSTPLLARLAASSWSCRRDGALWRIERTESWAAFAPGRTETLSYGYAIHGPADIPGRETRGVMTTPALTVRPVLPAATAATSPPSPLRAPVTRTFVPWQLAAALLAGTVVVILFASLLRRRRGSRGQRTADEVFDEELRMLEASLSKGTPEDPFYDWLAEITRWYVEQKLAIPAPRLTSAEIVAALRSRASETAAGDFGTILAICDGYRFARREHRREQAASAIAAAHEGAEALRDAEAAAEEPVRESA